MSIISLLDKEIFENLVKSSNSWVKVMIYFKDNYGYKNINSNSTAKKRCIKENISFVHFYKYKEKVELTKVINSTKTYDSSSLRKQTSRNMFKMWIR